MYVLKPKPMTIAHQQHKHDHQRNVHIIYVIPIYDLLGVYKLK